jgi:hypothetical protein
MIFSFISAASDSVTIHFPKKKISSVSTTRTIWSQNQGAKSLEVSNILMSAASRRKNLGSMDKIYQADQHTHLPEVKKEILVHCLIGLSGSASNQCHRLSSV